MASNNDLNHSAQNGNTVPSPAAPGASSSSGGFKLKLKVKAPSDSSTAASPAAATLQPPPAHQPQAYQPPPIPQSLPKPQRPPSIEPSPAMRPPQTVVTTPATSMPRPQNDIATPAPVQSEERVQTEPEHEDNSIDAREARGVSTARYRQLKKDYIQVTEDKDTTAASLLRAQRLIVRLREEKATLLDRVLALESAAGLTAAEVEAAQQRPAESAEAQSYPLLHPPSVISLADRSLRPSGVSTTQNQDLAMDDSKPKPTSLPPRLRSEVFMTELATQKLRESDDAKRAAHALTRGAHAAVAILGVEGSYIAENVERALAGEQFGAVSRSEDPLAQPLQSTSKNTGKRKRQSDSPVVQVRESLQGLPNPFSFGAATSSDLKTEQDSDAVTTIAPLPVPSHTHSPRAATAYSSYQSPNDQDLDEDARSARSGTYSEDEGGAELYHAGDGDASAAPAAAPKPAKKSRKSESGSRPKVKRQRVQAATPGRHTIPHTPRNPDGTPALPLPIGIMVLNNLGVVTHEENFSNDRYIFPVGYEAVRKYPSMVTRADTVDYVCRISYSPEGPHFDLHPADQPGVIITGSTPTGAWSQVVKAANKVRERNHTNSVSGPDYFGLSHNITKALIQELPGARDCVGYIWQSFEEEPHPDEMARRKAANKKGGGGGARRHSGRPEDEGGYLPHFPQQPYPGYSPHALPPLPLLPSQGQAYGGHYPDHGVAGHPPGLYHGASPTLYGSLAGSHAGLPQLAGGHAAPDTFDPYALPLGGGPSADAGVPQADPYAIPPSAPADPYAIPPPNAGHSGGGASLDPAYM